MASFSRTSTAGRRRDLCRNGSQPKLRGLRQTGLVGGGRQGAVNFELAVNCAQPVSPKNPHSLRVAIGKPGNGRTGVANNGFWGMALTKGQTYELSLYARSARSRRTTDRLAGKHQRNCLCAEEYSIPYCRLETLPTHPQGQRADPKARLAITARNRARFGSIWYHCFQSGPGRTGQTACGPNWRTCWPG